MPELKIITKDFGHINPGNIDTYMIKDGLKATFKALQEMSPEGVIDEIKASGLSGRGGAGFPTGVKWELARATDSDVKYLICNLDEGEVGTFKDRYLIENDPFSLIEGIAIAMYAIGAKKAYIYLRVEYVFLLDLVNYAIEEIRKKIEKFIPLNIEVYIGAGAYICGEETALIESIEEKRGDARFKPPFPPKEGLWGKPTVVNNVETLMNVPRILLHGATWFIGIGTDRSKGTKVFSICGDVEKPGIYELVMGSTIRELLDLAISRDAKMAQIGGASGRIIPKSRFDTPLSYETVLGSGGVVVFDKTRDSIITAFKTMEFFQEECCGKCAPCREGTRVMKDILNKFRKKEATKKDIENLRAISETMRLTSLCGLGQAAPNVVTDTLDNYKDEYLSRITG